MKNDFAENLYNAACNTIGEAVWQLVASGETVTQEMIADMIVMLSKEHSGLAESIALSVLKAT